MLRLTSNRSLLCYQGASCFVVPVSHPITSVVLIWRRYDPQSASYRQSRFWAIPQCHSPGLMNAPTPSLVLRRMAMVLAVSLSEYHDTFRRAVDEGSMRARNIEGIQKAMDTSNMAAASVHPPRHANGPPMPMPPPLLKEESRPPLLMGPPSRKKKYGCPLRFFHQIAHELPFVLPIS